MKEKKKRNSPHSLSGRSGPAAAPASPPAPSFPPTKAQPQQAQWSRPSGAGRQRPASLPSLTRGPCPSLTDRRAPLVSPFSFLTRALLGLGRWKSAPPSISSRFGVSSTVQRPYIKLEALATFVFPNCAALSPSLALLRSLLDLAESGRPPATAVAVVGSLSAVRDPLPSLTSM